MARPQATLTLTKIGGGCGVGAGGGGGGGHLRISVFFQSFFFPFLHLISLHLMHILPVNTHLKQIDCVCRSGLYVSENQNKLR